MKKVLGHVVIKSFVCAKPKDLQYYRVLTIVHLNFVQPFHQFADAVPSAPTAPR